MEERQAGVRLAAIAAALACAVSACSPPCPDGSPLAIYTLYFGENIPGRSPVTPAEWQSFLATTVTRELPGYTAWHAHGGWTDPATGKQEQDPTEVLVAAMPDTPESARHIANVRDGYAKAYGQNSVGMTVGRGCGSF